MKLREPIPIRKASNGKSYINLNVTELVPELAESEDERIRKEIIGYLNSRVATAEETELLYFKRWITYLEKQKEQKPISFNEPYNPDDYEVVMEGNATSLKLKEQKPAEWSEEDEHNLNSVINLVHNTSDGAWGSCIGDRIENWLKSLPERFNLQPKQEWSEEDEIRLKEALEVLDESIKYLPMGYGFIKDVMYVKDWLKSLRPSWKPSKEQIYSLGTVVNGMGESSFGVSKDLRDLYEQLKKL